MEDGHIPGKVTRHAEILRWRRQEALKKTKQMRPDLLERVNLTAADKKYLQ